MPADSVTAGERAPRRARYLIPLNVPHRGEYVAAIAVAVVLVHLLFAQLTIVFAFGFHGATKVSRWRPVWLAVPALVGLLWTLAIGPHAAAAGYAQGPAQVAGYLGGVGGHLGRLGHLGAAYAGIGGWLPKQIPLALIVGALEAACCDWLDWLHTDEWDLPASRPGLAVAVRRAVVTRAVRGGGVVTRDGACLGVTAAAGNRAAISWPEAAAGVLVVGAAGSAVRATSFQIVHAAIRRRQPVIVVDLGGCDELAGPLAAVCAGASAPLHRFGVDGPACYEPLRQGDAARRSALLAAAIDWSGTPDHCRRSCAAYLRDVFELLDAAPADPRVPVLDDVVHLLDPLAMRARLVHVPDYHPRRRILAERVQMSVSLVQADPQIVAAPARQLKDLRASPLSRWLRPVFGASAVRVDVADVLRGRAVACFSLAGHREAGALLARLVARDVLAAADGLREIGAVSDGVAWFAECAALPQPLLTDLLRRGGDTGLAAVATTTDPAAGAALAEHANALVIHRIPDADSAARLARLTGETLVPDSRTALTRPVPSAEADAPAGTAATAAFGSDPAITAGGRFPLVQAPAVSAATLRTLPSGEFVLAVKEPRSRLVPRASAVPARLPAAPRPGTAPVLAPAVTAPAEPAATSAATPTSTEKAR